MRRIDNRSCARTTRSLDFSMALSSERKLGTGCARSMYRFFKAVNVFHICDAVHLALTPFYLGWWAGAGNINKKREMVGLTERERALWGAVKKERGGGNPGERTGGMMGTAIVFFPAAPLFLFMHGKDITIPKGTEVTAYINGDIPLDPKRFAAQTTGNPEPGAAPVQPTAGATAAQNGSAADAALSTV